MKGLMLTATCLLVLATGASRSDATTATQLSNEDLARQSELIVVGRAQGSQSAWVGRQLVTLVTVAVDEVLKGSAQGSITVALPGGIDAQRRIKVAMTWPAAPSLAPKEEVFLFLTAGDLVDGSYAVTGFSQGKFSVVEEGGEKRVSRDLTRLSLAGPRGTARGTRTLTPLARFKQEIRSHLDRIRDAH